MNNFVVMYCNHCGKQFVNPCINDCAALCGDCRKTVGLDNDIRDKFTPEELDRLARGPISNIFSPDSPDNAQEDEEERDDYYDDDSDDELLEFEEDSIDDEWVDLDGDDLDHNDN